ncbi:MAG: hypothetical protein ACR2LF_08190 [Jatrophihabitantaceae bacterium]
MGQFTVDPDSFGPLADQLRHSAADLETAWAPVLQQSQSLHFGRGDDLISPLIQVSIQGAVALVDSCMKSSAKALTGYAGGLQQMGATYRQAEEHTTSLLTPR